MERTGGLPCVVWEKIAIYMGPDDALALRVLSRGMRAAMGTFGRFWQLYYPLDDYEGPLSGYYLAVMREARTQLVRDARRQVRVERRELVAVRKKLETRRRMVEEYTKRIPEWQAEIVELEEELELQETDVERAIAERQEAVKMKRRKI